MRQYERGEPDAIAQVEELLVEGGESLDLLTLTVSPPGIHKLGDIEQIDHLITVAEGRRNRSLREIDRRRAVLGAALLRNVQEIETDEYKLIAPRARGASSVSFQHYERPVL